MEPLRINNIECRVAQHFGRDTDYIEIIKWYPNNYYKRENEFIWDDMREMYKDPKWYNHFIDPSCFKHPESCYVVAYTSRDYNEEPNIKSVGSRPFRLTKEEREDYIKVVKYIFESLNDSE